MNSNIEQLIKEVNNKDVIHFFRNIISKSYKIRVINFPDSMIYLDNETYEPLLVKVGTMSYFDNGNEAQIPFHIFYIPHETNLKYQMLMYKKDLPYGNYETYSHLREIFSEMFQIDKEHMVVQENDSILMRHERTSQIISTKLLIATAKTINFEINQGRIVEVTYVSERDSYRVSRIFEA